MTLPAQDESVNAPKIEKMRNSFLFFITMIINLFYKQDNKKETERVPS